MKHIVIAAAGAPWANGQIKRVNRTLTPILSKLQNERALDWDCLLTEVEFVFNNMCNKTTRETPSKLLLGCEHIQYTTGYPIPDNLCDSLKVLLEDEKLARNDKIN